MATTTLFSSMAGGNVDVENGIIKNVSVITLGEAKGHGCFIDEPALGQILDLANSQPEGVKVKANHGSGVLETIGRLVGFRKVGDQIKADFELLKSADCYSKVLEMAQKLATQFGFSVNSSADYAKKDGKKYVRFKELESVDLVDAPAANPNGLFSQLNNNNNTMLKQFAVKLGLPETATEAEITAKLDELELAKKSLEEKEKEDKEKELAAKKKLEEDEKEKKEMSALQAFELRLSAIEAKATEQVQLAEKNSKKAALEALVAEASRDGKVIPLTDEELMGLPLDTVKSMFSKLPKGQVKLSSQPAPKNDGKVLRGAELVQFCQAKKHEGALALNEVFASLNKQN